MVQLGNQVKSVLYIIYLPRILQTVMAILYAFIWSGGTLNIFSSMPADQILHNRILLCWNSNEQWLSTASSTFAMSSRLSKFILSPLSLESAFLALVTTISIFPLLHWNLFSWNTLYSSRCPASIEGDFLNPVVLWSVTTMQTRKGVAGMFILAYLWIAHVGVHQGKVTRKRGIWSGSSFSLKFCS